MKPVTINLVHKKDIKGKVFLGFVVMFVLSTFIISAVNLIDYFENTKVIKIYESRIQKINKRSIQKKAAQKSQFDKKDQAKFIEELNFLNAIIKKNLFPLSEVLTELERIKPDKIDINGLKFTENHYVLKILGESNHVSSVSDFLIAMEKSSRFIVEISKEEINEDKRIIFELIAKWKPIAND